MQRQTQRQTSTRNLDPAEILMPAVPIQNCPIATSLGVLGRKWTMLIIRDLGMRKIQRFNQLLGSISGLTPRILSIRLKELEKEGFIQRANSGGRPNGVHWSLTEKGVDTIPILIQFVAFGSKWYANRVFADQTPRSLAEVYPRWDTGEMGIKMEHRQAPLRSTVSSSI